MKKNSSNFIKVKCVKCKNEQTIFNKPSTQVNCLVCGEALCKSKGGKAKLYAKFVESF
ncbi:MAG: 30S ribosomal protein S27e [Candidatus Nanoarchaeia archaeon]|nr:30S ribosomal protein S27e [Candidatus Nanoarchaeia archaeon]MDD5053913.1 30S ribosomal protein S27e [Candidatus Nanoarchaeia archaeon]MDD5499894.1 30S ribosomal protein S27e [Candidatus Nanoarchaeia archaeon]